LFTKKQIVINELKADMINWSEKQDMKLERIIEENRRHNEEEEQYRRERVQKLKEYEDQQKQKESYYQNYLLNLKVDNLEKVKQKFNFKERELFERLLVKYHFNNDTFPSCFNVMTPHNFLIQTPHNYGNYGF
jgi:hypothetical protein